MSDVIVLDVSDVGVGVVGVVVVVVVSVALDVAVWLMMLEDVVVVVVWKCLTAYCCLNSH